jgi:hypothetical protein
MNLRVITAFFLSFIIPIILAPIESMANIVVVGGLTREVNIKKLDGNTSQGTIILKNMSEESQEAKMYQTDYEFFYDGRNNYGEPGKMARSNANWITFTPKQLIIPANGISEVNYSIKIPNDKALIGTYWSLIMIEESPKVPSPELKTEGKEMKLGIQSNKRYAIQIVTNIGDTSTISLNFISVKLIKEGEKRIFQIDMENVGEKWAKPMLYIELYNEAGNYIGKFDGEKKRIYPGTSVRFNIDLSELPKGKYKAMVMADCGGDDIFGATYNLAFKDEPNVPSDSAPK